MTLRLIYLFIIILLLIATISISAMIIKRERYVLLGNMGRTQIKNTKMYPKKDYDKPKSLKYRDHRYDRHHIRSNPHVRRYQDSF
jgi:hypothetical protein